MTWTRMVAGTGVQGSLPGTPPPPPGVQAPQQRRAEPLAPRAGLAPPELLPAGRPAQAAAPLLPLAPQPLQAELTIPESEGMDGWLWPAWEIVQARESTQFPCCLPLVQPLNRRTNRRKGRSRRTARPRLCRCGQLYMTIMLKAKMNSD